MERRSVVNASRQSFEPAVNNEATKSPSVAARAGTREWKRPPAPGEIPVKALSDGGSTPPISTMSEQALYRLLRLFLQKSERTHAAAPPFQITTAALGCDLVWANPLDNSIYTVWITHVGASFISLAPTFLQKSERTHAAAPPFQITTAALGCDLVWANKV